MRIHITRDRAHNHEIIASVDATHDRIDMRSANAICLQGVTKDGEIVLVTLTESEVENLTAMFDPLLVCALAEN